MTSDIFSDTSWTSRSDWCGGCSSWPRAMQTLETDVGE